MPEVWYIHLDLGVYIPRTVGYSNINDMNDERNPMTDPWLVDGECYPGTEMLKRLCYGCEDPIENLDDGWVDVDDNCVVCTTCRNKSRDYYDTEQQWQLSITSLRGWDADTVNDLDQG